MCAMPNIAIFCSSFIPGMLLTQLSWVILNWFQSPLLLLVLVLLSYSTCSEFLLWGFYILKSSQLLSWSHFCLQELQHLLTCMFPFLLSRIMMSGWLVGIVLSFCTCWFYNMVTLPSWLVLTDSGTWSYQCSLYMLKCSWAHTMSYLCLYCSFASIRHADMMYSTVSSNCLQSLHLLPVSVCNIFVTDIWVLIFKVLTYKSQ